MVWQPAQERAMKCGPRPSRAVVEAGASTQLRLKKELPITKRVRSGSLRSARGNENALRPVANTVPLPPTFSPSGSGSVSAMALAMQSERRCANSEAPHG